MKQVLDVIGKGFYFLDRDGIEQDVLMIVSDNGFKFAPVILYEGSLCNVGNDAQFIYRKPATASAIDVESINSVIKHAVTGGGNVTINQAPLAH